MNDNLMTLAFRKGCLEYTTLELTSYMPEYELLIVKKQFYIENISNLAYVDINKAKTLYKNWLIDYVLCEL